MPVSPARFHSTAIILPQACFKYSIFSREKVEKLQGHHWSDKSLATCFSFFPLHQQNLYRSSFTVSLCLSKPRSLPLTSAPVRDTSAPGMTGTQAHKHWWMMCFLRKRKQVIKMTSRHDLCVFGNSDTHTYHRLARDSSRASGGWRSIGRSLAQSEELVGHLKSDRVEYAASAGAELDGEICLNLFWVC